MALVAVVVLAVVAWTWLRPAWQTRSIVSDLREIDGVSSVGEPRDDGGSPTFRVELDGDTEPETLADAASDVRMAVDDRQVGGDEVTAEVRLDGFLLDDAMRGSVSENLLRTVVALRDVEGLTAVRANDTFLDVRASPDELLSRTAEALTRLGSADAYSRTTLRVQPKGNGPTVSASIAGAKEEAPALRRLAEVVDTTGVSLTTGGDPGAGLRLFAEGKDLECSAEVLLDEPRRLREVADVFATIGEECRTTITTSDDKRMVTVASGADGVDRAFDLLARLEKAGVAAVGVSSDLQSLSGSVTDGSGLIALKNLTESDDWPLATAAPLTIKWADTDWLALKLKKAGVLQRYGAGMARLRDAGFVASLAVQTEEGDRSITVTDDVEGAPSLTEPSGRSALVKALRGSGLPGEVFLTIVNKLTYNGVSFRSTAAGEAADIQLPKDGRDTDTSSPTAWADDFMALWSSTERG